MFITGSLVNGIAIGAGALLGSLLTRIPEGIKGTVMHAIGLAVMVLGLQMGLKGENFLIVILSLVSGAITGELLKVDERLNKLGYWLEQKVGSKGNSNISQGFITATLIFVIGAMGVIGALDSGIRGNHEVLFTKSLIDGITALILTTTLGIGVLFSAVPVLLYEGLIALFATQIDRFVSQEWMDSFILEMTAAGGIMIFAIGLNLLQITNIRIANLLPAIAFVALFVTFWP